ncbi:ABC transporter [Neobacillus sp. YX16]|uniref:ABC transporter n=1 Tax=Neobacillus sp. YX16 TaxID=3047874 RepID=UPI0024C2FE52|nr:ABC transporter [Neobacillus sp. YX16]WHZ05571.1 ABC transporter [Neobacillus sp. YX16]
MSNGHSSCGILGLFLGFLTGVFWLLLSIFHVVTDFFTLINLGSLGAILNILIALIGFLVLIVFGLLIFKKVWRCYIKK